MEGTMGTKPLGAYIRVLRRHLRPRVSQRKLAETVETSNNTIYRIEAGVQEPQEVLAAILSAIGGRIEDVPKLKAPDASIDLAERLAAEAITERALLEWAKTDKQRMQLLNRIKEMSDDDPELRSRIDGYLDRLQGH
jgi:DNA-binding XRE family transcriptional regulator